MSNFQKLEDILKGRSASSLLARQLKITSLTYSAAMLVLNFVRASLWTEENLAFEEFEEVASNLHNLLVGSF